MTTATGAAKKMAVAEAISAKSVGVCSIRLFRRNADHCVCLSAAAGESGFRMAGRPATAAPTAGGVDGGREALQLERE